MACLSIKLNRRLFLTVIVAREPKSLLPLLFRELGVYSIRELGRDIGVAGPVLVDKLHESLESSQSMLSEDEAALPRLDDRSYRVRYVFDTDHDFGVILWTLRENSESFFVIGIRSRPDKLRDFMLCELPSMACFAEI